MYNQTAVKSITTSTTTEDNTMITLGQLQEREAEGGMWICSVDS